MSRTRNQRMNINPSAISDRSDKMVNNNLKNRKNVGNLDKTLNKKTIIVVLVACLTILSAFIVIEEKSFLRNETAGNTGPNTPASTLPSSIGDFSLVKGQPYTINGKIPVLFVGSLACPYCAEQSWSIYSALKDMGGSWNGLAYDYSNLSDKYPNTPGLNFANATYANPEVAFFGYEISNREWQPYQTLNTTNDALFNQYDSASHIPFILIGGVYLHIGDSYSPALLANLTGSEVMNLLINGKNSSVADMIINESITMSDIVNLLLNSKAHSTSAISDSLATIVFQNFQMMSLPEKYI